MLPKNDRGLYINPENLNRAAVYVKAVSPQRRKSYGAEVRRKKTVFNLQCGRTLFIACLSFLALMGATNAGAQSESNSATAGKEFYVSFLHNGHGTPFLQLKIVVKKPCRITAKYNQLAVYWQGWDNVEVQPGIYTADVFDSFMVNTGTGTSKKTISITSTEDIQVYAINFSGGSTDATTVLPVSAWGTEYYLATGMWNQGSTPSTYSVTAKEDGTKVYFNPVDFGLPSNASPVTLNKGEVYHCYSTQDLTGKKITADKPVAVFSGNVVGASAGNTKYGWPTQLGGSAEHCYEQLWSADKWGTDFFVWPVETPTTPGSDWGGLMAIVAREAGTKVTVSGGINGGAPLYRTLNAEGVKYVCYQMSGLTRVVSDKPIMVFTILPDAAITYIPPTAQRITHATLSPFILDNASSKIEKHAVELLIPKAYWEMTEIKEIKGNDTVVSRSTYEETTSADFPDWYTVRKELPNEDVEIDVSCPGGLLAYMYGYGGAESYGYLAGAGAYNLQCYFTIREQATNYETYYKNTSETTHTFLPADTIRVKRIIEQDITSPVKWLVNGDPYMVEAKNDVMMDSLKIPAEIFHGGKNTLTMSVRFQGAAADSLYTADIWLEVPEPLEAVNDTVVTLSGASATVDALDNDLMPGACTPAPAIVTKPKHGKASVQGQTITYTPPPAPWHGKDSMEYKISCDAAKDSAWVFINVSRLPDNIVDAACLARPSVMEWKIAQNFIGNETDIATTVSPVAGDLDGDGIPEILAAKYSKDFGEDILYNGIYIYWGADRQTPTLVNVAESYAQGYGFSIAKVNDKPAIVVAGYDGYLYAYDPDPAKTNEAASLLWKSNCQLDGYTSGGTAYAVGFADFDGDGEAEVYAGNQIFNAATGVMLVDGGAGTNKGVSSGYNSVDRYCPFAADVTGDGYPEYLAGTAAYAALANNSLTPVAGVPDIPVAAGSPSLKDGATTVADVNGDGRLDVLVSAVLNANTYGFAAWDVKTQSLIAQGYDNTSSSRCSMPPAIGDIDGDSKPEIVFASADGIRGYRWDGAQSFDKIYESAAAGNAGVTLFDFDRDSIAELVYRDPTHVRILQADGASFRDVAQAAATAETDGEHAIVVDADNDGQAEIVTTGGAASGATQGSLRIFKSGDRAGWAPARKVWNQYMYHSVNVDEGLTIPAFPLSPATTFPGKDGLPGTSDDVRPYNNFLQQQTALNKNGDPLWLAPNAVFDESHITTSNVGDSVSISLCIVNLGAAALQAPVYATLYKDSVKPANRIATDSVAAAILPGDTACLTIGVADISPWQPFVQLVVRLNDDGVATYPVQQECDCGDSVRTRLNPLVYLMMEKHATLNPRQPDKLEHDGRYANPVSVLFSDTIQYKITAVNANLSAGRVIITDTLPPYLEYAGGASAGASTGTVNGTPQRNTIRWEIANVAPFDAVAVSYEATPERGASASQPLYVNRAWVRVSDTILAPTNSTYHQGAGVSVVTFSASPGGSLYHTEPQALDYRTSPRAEGILVVPDSGYAFAGWSHDEYTSLRGETIPPDSGKMNCEEIVIYGNVELRANFVSIAGEPGDKDPAGEKETDKTDKVWSYDSDIYIRAKKGAIVRIYTVDGRLRRQFIASADGVTTVRLARGAYIVTLNGGAGYKVMVRK